MALHCLIVEGWHPATVNQLLHNRWSGARLKRRDRMILAPYGLAFPKATGRRRVTLEITLTPRQRACDSDAYWKSCLDALVHAGLLVDDHPKHVELMPVRFERGPHKRSRIFLEDIE